jgi:GT2 family glycosyltransferase
MILTNPKLVISIVSHCNGDIILNLLGDLSKLDYSGFSSVKIIITQNIPEIIDYSDFGLPVILQINKYPLGFGANHNQAFKKTQSDLFVVLNPDIRIMDKFNFSSFVLPLEDKYELVSPLIYSLDMKIEDSFRKYPSIFRLIKRYFSSSRSSDYETSLLSYSDILPVDWVAGMFMVFSSCAFNRISGFDTKYFMYLEDADICKRINRGGEKVGIVGSEYAIHDARRKTFKNLQHFTWHTRSMIRFIFRC